MPNVTANHTVHARSYSRDIDTSQPPMTRMGTRYNRHVNYKPRNQRLFRHQAKHNHYVYEQDDYYPNPTFFDDRDRELKVPYTIPYYRRVPNSDRQIRMTQEERAQIAARAFDGYTKQDVYRQAMEESSRAQPQRYLQPNPDRDRAIAQANAQHRRNLDHILDQYINPARAAEFQHLRQPRAYHADTGHEDNDHDDETEVRKSLSKVHFSDEYDDNVDQDEHPSKVTSDSIYFGFSYTTDAPTSDNL